MERKEPIKIKLFGRAPRYYCGKCMKRIYKRHKFCPHCFTKKNELIEIDWEEIK